MTGRRPNVPSGEIDSISDDHGRANVLAENGTSVVAATRVCALVRPQSLPQRGLGALAYRVGADSNDPQDIRFSRPILARFLKEINAIGNDHGLANLPT